MTNIIILSEEEIQVFESPPRFTYEERKHFFIIPEWAKPLFSKLATPISKIGFILQLGYFRATNKVYTKDLYYPEDIAFVKKRIGIDGEWHTTLYSERMIKRHRKMILSNLDYTAFSPGATAAISKDAASAVEKQIRLKDIFGQLLEVLDQKKIAVPRYGVLATIITNEFRRHEKWMLTQITNCLTQEDRKLLDELLSVDEKMYESLEKKGVTKKRHRVTLLKKFHQSTRPKKIKANIADLLVIKDLFTRFVPVYEKLQLTRPVIEHYATITINAQHSQIERRNELRYLYLLCFIVHQ
jgi:hypothetical protein